MSQLKTQHTKGPWIVWKGKDYITVETKDGQTIIPPIKYPDEEQRANSRLIAAAPELLEALKELTEEAFKNMAGGAGHLVDNAYAAIAKATGA